MERPLADLAAAFVAASLPKAEWTHRAHLRVGLWHLLHHSREEALNLLRDRIRALNESHGVANTKTGGYHESITRFYVWQIATHLDASAQGIDPEVLAESLIERYGAKDLPLQYWTRERLFTPEARVGWVPPDLQALVG